MDRQVSLYIDRDAKRCGQLSRNIKTLGFELHIAAGVTIAKNLAKKHYYPLVLMHLDAVGNEIFAFCSFIRFICRDAVLIALMPDLKVGIEEKLFDCDVNDVVVGRQGDGELLIKRIRAHLHNIRAIAQDANKIMLKDTLIDFDRREVWCNGSARPLPGILADLLRYFIDNPNRVISRAELRNSPIWADSICSPSEEGGKTFDVNVGKLRKIIEPDSGNPQIIKSVRGIGWKLTLQAVG